ncbi:MAG: hypothetical protein ACRESK_01850 [Gammaproteobacteria bacterium]
MERRPGGDRGERQSRERPHREVRARTFKRSGTRSAESRNRAYEKIMVRLKLILFNVK